MTDRLPSQIIHGDLAIQRWTESDIAPMESMIARNLDHLRPWMAWARDEPITSDQRRQLFERWDRRWASGRGAVYALRVDGELLGGGALHRRTAIRGAEIGYWGGPSPNRPWRTALPDQSKVSVSVGDGNRIGNNLFAAAGGPRWRPPDLTQRRARNAVSETRRSGPSSLSIVAAMSTDYRLVPIDSSTADDLRAGGGPRYTVDATPGYPCRQCLRDAEVGESLVLVAHDPFTVDSPYRSRSAIFLHEQPCTPPREGADLPDQLTRRQLAVRAFDRDAMMIDAAVIHGRDLDDQLRRFFDDPATAEVHVHNAGRGCWATSVVRVDATGGLRPSGARGSDR